MVSLIWHRIIISIFQRDHTKMVLFLIFMAVGVVIQFVQVIAAGWAVLASAIFGALLSLYFFLCIYSLYALIKEEKTGQAYA